MFKITPSNRGGPHKTGTVKGPTATEITQILGFAPNIDDDPDKVRYSWAFEVEFEDGSFEYGAIWDWKGSGAWQEWSTYGSPDMFRIIGIGD